MRRFGKAEAPLSFHRCGGEIHGDVGKLLGAAMIVDLNHKGALELGRGPSLAPKTRQDFARLSAAPRIDQLHRNVSAERNMLSTPHLAHRASTNTIYQTVAIADHRPWPPQGILRVGFLHDPSHAALWQHPAKVHLGRNTVNLCGLGPHREGETRMPRPFCL